MTNFLKRKKYTDDKYQPHQPLQNQIPKHQDTYAKPDLYHTNRRGANEGDRLFGYNFGYNEEDNDELFRQFNDLFANDHPEDFDCTNLCDA